MFWVLVIVLFPVAIWLASWIADNQEYGSGPLYWVASLLTVALLGLAMYMAHLQKQGPIPNWLWLVVAGFVVVILILRRALRQR